jgi:rod shape-determining protein MreC
MRNLFRFLLRYHFVILFVLFESFSLSLVVQNNNFHKARFVNYVRSLQGFLYSKINVLSEYLALQKINQKLVAENNRLNNTLQRLYSSDESLLYGEGDTAYQQHYLYFTARIINNSVNKQYNFITLNKGSKTGIEPEMAVISPDGVVGVVKGVSKRFATVMSLLNTNLKISAKLKKNNYYGSLFWDGRDYRKVILQEIPYHVEISMGDTIVTSGFSTIYPEGVFIGTVCDYQIKGGNFYEITVELATDFKNLNYVSVVSNLHQQEQLELEQSFEND